MKADQSSMKYLGLGVEFWDRDDPARLSRAFGGCRMGLCAVRAVGLLVGIGGLIKSVRRVMKDYQTTLNAMQPPPEQMNGDGEDKDHHA